MCTLLATKREQKNPHPTQGRGTVSSRYHPVLPAPHDADLGVLPSRRSPGSTMTLHQSAAQLRRFPSSGYSWPGSDLSCRADRTIQGRILPRMQLARNTAACNGATRHSLLARPRRAFNLQLGGHFQRRRSAGISAPPTLCSRIRRLLVLVNVILDSIDR